MPIDKDNYFSKLTCDCGCENLMPQHLVDRGWKYLRGHKPQGGHISTRPKTFGSTKTLHLHSVAVDAQSILKFAKAQLQTLKKEVEAAEESILKANTALDLLVPKVRCYELIVEQLEKL